MRYASKYVTVGLVLVISGTAWAGGSNYGISPGSRPNLEGRISEWAVPTPKFARDPAPGPDGQIYIAVMRGNKIARFDPSATAPSAVLIRPRERSSSIRRRRVATRTRWSSMTRE